MTISQRIEALVLQSPGLTDREITDSLFSRAAPQQPVNRACRLLQQSGRLARRRRPQGLIGNYPAVRFSKTPHPHSQVPTDVQKLLSEDQVKRSVSNWMQSAGWHVRVMWGTATGTDIQGQRGNRKWLVEVKGSGKYPQMRVNYFLSVLGEILQRMDDIEAVYSIALPDIDQYRRLWERLPRLARERTRLTLLLVDSSGHITTLK